MPTEKTKILFIDDDKNFRKVTAYSLKESGFAVTTAENGQQGLDALEACLPDVILCDLKMPVLDGMGFLKEKRKRGDTIPVIVLTAFGSIENAVSAMRTGAVDYITKPINREELLLALGRVLDHQKLKRENRDLREQLAGGKAVDRLIGSSPAINALRETLLRLAESDAPVLIRGESGVGKELAARALHFDGPRASSGRFVVLNCAAIPGELLESELFGHRKGSFTGAHENRTGKFEAANNGTLFLDEIGDMPLALQAKLLRALQEGEVTRIGESEPRQVDVRVLAATNQPLEEKIQDGGFRQDLYYRLAVVPVELPPLRARLEDLEILLRHFLAKYGAPKAKATKEALAKLNAHAWPGNVRELENAVMRACALFPDLQELDAEHLALVDASGHAVALSVLREDVPVDLPDEGMNFEALEKNILQVAWEKSGHRQKRGAKLLGMSRQAFIYRLQKFGILPQYGARGKKVDE